MEACFRDIMDKFDSVSVISALSVAHHIGYDRFKSAAMGYILEDNYMECFD